MPLRRAARILAVLGALPLRFVGRLLVSEEPLDADARSRVWGDLLAASLESLGATFVKFGQILGARPDLIPAGWVGPLTRLQDHVTPAPFASIERVLAEELGSEGVARFASIEPVPVAAASVAQVHAAWLEDGTKVAVKVQRPEAPAQIEADLRVLRRVVGWIDRVPSMRLLSLPGAVEAFGAALHAQLDFVREADNNRRLAHNFRRERKVRLPGLHPSLCTARVLVMDFVEGVKATAPEHVGAHRSALAELGGRAILKMVFEDGFVHADLHPGNILLGADGTLTFLDLGLVDEIPDDMRRPWIDTFAALARQDGPAAARLFYEHAPTVGTDDYEEYERDVVAFLGTLWGVRLGDIEVGTVVAWMMNVLRRHRVQIEPVFTVVNVALLVAEGLGKQLDPQIDLVALAGPYLLGAALTAPPGRAPRRRAGRRTQHSV